MNKREEMIEKAKHYIANIEIGLEFYENWDKYAERLIDVLIPEDTFILTKEELVKTMESGYVYDTTRGNKVNVIEMAREIERKEAVKEFAKNFENYLCDVNNDYCTDDTVPEALYTSAEINNVIDKTLKDFGVEEE